MLLKTIARATVSACFVAACSGNTSGPMEDFEEPAGPFSGLGYPGRSIYRNPGIFSGPGSPGVGGTTDVTSLCAGVCVRVNAVCPTTNSNQDVCVASCQSDWNKLTTDCARNVYYGFMTCLLSASITCNTRGQATTESCQAPSISHCGATPPSTTTGTGGTGGSTGGTGGTGGSTGGTGGSTGGTGGSTGGTGGSTGGTGGSTGGTGGSTGGTGGSTGGTGGAAGTGGGGGRGGRDGGRG